MTLYLIPQFSFDPKLKDRLRVLYNHISPEVLLTNVSNEDLVDYDNFHASVYNELGSRINLDNGDKQKLDKLMNRIEEIHLSDYLMNEEFSKERNLEHHLIGIPNGRKRRLESIGIELVSHLKINSDVGKMLRYFSGEIPPDLISDEWNRILKYERGLFLELDNLINRFIHGFIGKKDKFLESEIREIYEGKVTALPIEMIHCEDSLTKSTLYSRIKDLNPIRKPAFIVYE